MIEERQEPTETYLAPHVVAAIYLSLGIPPPQPNVVRLKVTAGAAGNPLVLVWERNVGGVWREWVAVPSIDPAEKTLDKYARFEVPDVHLEPVPRSPRIDYKPLKPVTEEWGR